jgi:uncharacterized membrane protein YbhN (UPF0104 family)
VRLIVLKLALTAAVVAALAAQVDVGAALGRFADLGWTAAALCLAVGLLQIGLLAFRWVLVSRLARVALPAADALRCMLAAQFFSQGLPASVGGDALRIWWLSRLGVGVGAAARCVLLDRVAGLLSLFLLGAAAAGVLAAAVGRADSGAEIAGAVGVGAAAALLGASRLGRRIALSAALALPARAMSARGVRRTLLWALKLQRAAGALVFTPAGAATLAWGAGIHLLTVAVAWIVAREAGLAVGAGALFAVVVPVMLLSYLPVSIGGWGVREGGMAAAFVLVGQTAEAGVFVGLAMGALGLGSALLGALVWLVSPMPVSLLGRPRPAPGPADAARP